MRPQQTTRVPAVLDGLLELFAAAPDLAGVQVIDGPALSMDQIERDSISLAPGTPDEPGVFVTYAEESGLGRVSYVEQIEVKLGVVSFSGDSDMKARRDRVTELLDGIKNVVDANQVRDGAWDSLMLGPEAAWHPVQSAAGATCAVGITLVTTSVI